ncbi:hypothetical protein CAEBREN_03840 [Caenorhabditis brenneri]|uniref:Uncharacterized protein n=1 Tax=Caenorhabditis brenneri TaxID=135651 RepID=G0NFF3_CAEBE|nr:hypothetical protein CAEBREN_03840 [Caenorhabditis brenneri]
MSPHPLFLIPFLMHWPSARRPKRSYLLVFSLFLPNMCHANIVKKEEPAFAREDDLVLAEDDFDEETPELPRIAARQRKPKVTKRRRFKKKGRARKATVGQKTVKRRKKGTRKRTGKAKGEKVPRVFREKQPTLHIRQNDDVIVMDEEPAPKPAPKKSRPAQARDILGSILTGQAKQLGTSAELGPSNAAERGREAARKRAEEEAASKKAAAERDAARREEAAKRDAEARKDAAARREEAKRKAAMNRQSSSRAMDDYGQGPSGSRGQGPSGSRGQGPSGSSRHPSQEQARGGPRGMDGPGHHPRSNQYPPGGPHGQDGYGHHSYQSDHGGSQFGNEHPAPSFQPPYQMGAHGSDVHPHPSFQHPHHHYPGSQLMDGYPPQQTGPLASDVQPHPPYPQQHHGYAQPQGPNGGYKDASCWQGVPMFTRRGPKGPVYGVHFDSNGRPISPEEYLLQQQEHFNRQAGILPKEEELVLPPPPPPPPLPPPLSPPQPPPQLLKEPKIEEVAENGGEKIEEGGEKIEEGGEKIEEGGEKIEEGGEKIEEGGEEKEGDASESPKKKGRKGPKTPPGSPKNPPQTEEASPRDSNSMGNEVLSSSCGPDAEERARDMEEMEQELRVFDDESERLKREERERLEKEERIRRLNEPNKEREPPQRWWGVSRYAEYIEALFTPELNEAINEPSKRRVLATLAYGAQNHRFDDKQCKAHLLEALRFYCLGYDENGMKKYPLTNDHVPETHQMRWANGFVFRVEGDDEEEQRCLKEKAEKEREPSLQKENWEDEVYEIKPVFGWDTERELITTDSEEESEEEEEEEEETPIRKKRKIVIIDDDSDDDYYYKNDNSVVIKEEIVTEEAPTEMEAKKEDVSKVPIQVEPFKVIENTASVPSFEEPPKEAKAEKREEPELVESIPVSSIVEDPPKEARAEKRKQPEFVESIPILNVVEGLPKKTKAEVKKKPDLMESAPLQTVVEDLPKEDRAEKREKSDLVESSKKRKMEPSPNKPATIEPAAALVETPSVVENLSKEARTEERKKPNLVESTLIPVVEDLSNKARAENVKTPDLGESAPIAPTVVEDLPKKARVEKESIPKPIIVEDSTKKARAEKIKTPDLGESAPIRTIVEDLPKKARVEKESIPKPIVVEDSLKKARAEKRKNPDLVESSKKRKIEPSSNKPATLEPSVALKKNEIMIPDAFRKLATISPNSLLSSVVQVADSTLAKSQSSKKRKIDPSPKKPATPESSAALKKNEILISAEVRKLANNSPNSLLSSVVQVADNSPLSNSQSSSSPPIPDRSSMESNDGERPDPKRRKSNDKPSKSAPHRSARVRAPSPSPRRAPSPSPRRSSSQRHATPPHRSSSVQCSVFLAFGQNGGPNRGGQGAYEARKAEIAMHLERKRVEEEAKQMERGRSRGGRGGGHIGHVRRSGNGVFYNPGNGRSRSRSRRRSPRRCKSMAPDRERVSSPPVERRARSPPLARRQHSPPNRQAPPPVQRRVRALPQQPRGHVAPAPRRSATPPPQRRHHAAPPQHRHHSPSVGRRPASPPNQGKHHAPEAQRRHHSPPIERREASPPVERRPPPPPVQARQPSPGKHIAPAERPAPREHGRPHGSGSRRTRSPSGSPARIGRFQDHRLPIRKLPLSARIVWPNNNRPDRIRNVDRP